MGRRTIRSLSIPITLAAVAIPVSIAMLAAWTWLVIENASLIPREATRNAWLITVGAIAFAVILGVLVMFSVFLVREMLEVRRQDSFIDSVTHELKSPLASLKLCLQTQGREGIDSDQREELRQMMLNDVHRLSSFIDDVLQASRLAHQQTGLNLNEVGLKDLADRCVDNIAAHHKTPRENIRVRIPSSLAIWTDGPALEIILKNLIDNAVKYSQTPVQVDINAWTQNHHHAVIEVRDKGIGIGAKHLKRVFHRFYRVPAEVVRARHGTGLGLFVVSALVRNMGGKVEAISDGPGRGTTIRVKLPTRSDSSVSVRSEQAVT